MLVDQIRQAIATSLKKRDKVRAEVMRFLLADIRNAAIAKYGAQSETSLTDEDVLDVVRKQVKSHRESIAAYTAGGRPELAEKETAELELLEMLLPPELTDADIQKLISKMVSETDERAFGPLMGKIMKATDGRADGKRVAALLKKALG